MEKIYELFKVELGSFSRFMNSVIGYIALSFGLGASFTRIFESKLTLSISTIGIFFIINRVCNKIINSKRESFGVLINQYSKRSVRIAYNARVINFLLWAIPFGFLTQSFVTKKHACNLSPNLGLIITNFSQSENDAFSYHLFQKLQPELNDDTVSVMRYNEFVKVGFQNYIDSIQNIFNDNCLTHGLLVYGSRNPAENLFDCNIFINKLENLHQNTDRPEDKNNLYLENPDLVHFSIDSQANVVCDFILGLLNYNSNNFEMSKVNLKRALATSTNADPKLISYCHLFIGNDFYKMNDFSQAISEYNNGINLDSANAYLHYNLANSLLKISDTAKAKGEYQIARNLDDRLKIPLFQHLNERVNKKNDTSGFKKNITSIKSQVISTPSENKKSASKCDFHLLFSNGKFGIADEKGDVVLKCEYDSIYPNEVKCNQRIYFIVQKNSLFGAVDQLGNVEVPYSYTSAEKVIVKIETTNGDAR